MYTQTEKVNIRPKSYLPVFRVSEGDVGRTLTAHLVSDEGDISIPAGATVTMAGTKPSGLGYTVTGTVDGTDVSFETDAVMTDEPGRVVSEIRIVQDGTVIGTTNVVLSVEPNPHPDDTTDGRREPLVNEITALLEQITEQADRVEEYSGKVLDMTVTAHESDEVTVTKTEGEVVNLDFGLPRGPQGPQGIPGEDGQDGVTPDFTIGTVETLAPGEQATATITGTEEDPVLNLGIPQGAKGDKGDPGEVTQADFDKLLITDTASGEIASFPDGAAFPMRSLKITLEPIQSGSGTPSPDNVRPISGWDSVETVVSGKNLIDQSAYTWLDATSYSNGVFTAETLSTFSSAMVRLYKNGTVVNTINKAPTEGSRVSINVTVDDTWDVCFIGYRMGGASNVGGSFNKPIVADGTYTVSFMADKLPSTSVYGKFSNIQFEQGSTATAYEPYQGQTYTATLPTTVYGGTLDVVNGTLTVDRVIFEGQDVTWTASSSVVGRFIRALPEALAMLVGKLATSSHFPTANNSLATTKGVYVNSPRQLLVTQDNITTLADWNAFLQSNKTSEAPVQFTIPLANPITLTIDAQEVQTLLGRNNVWSDGTVSIEYVADPKRYIQKMIGA